MTIPTAPALEAPPVVLEEIDPIHPYILESLQAARADDLDALAWLGVDRMERGDYGGKRNLQTCTQIPPGSLIKAS